MDGYWLLCGFLVCGAVASDALFRRHCGLVRLWLGLAGGLLLMMWMPALYAFLLGFTRTAQWCGLITAAIFARGCAFLRRKEPHAAATFCGSLPPWLLGLAVPLLILSGYLQYTHILREVDGALHVG